METLAPPSPEHDFGMKKSNNIFSSKFKFLPDGEETFSPSTKELTIGGKKSWKVENFVCNEMPWDITNEDSYVSSDGSILQLTVRDETKKYIEDLRFLQTSLEKHGPLKFLAQKKETKRKLCLLSIGFKLCCYYFFHLPELQYFWLILYITILFLVVSWTIICLEIILLLQEELKCSKMPQVCNC